MRNFWKCDIMRDTCSALSLLKVEVFTAEISLRHPAT